VSTYERLKDRNVAWVREILASVKPLAGEYYRLWESHWLSPGRSRNTWRRKRCNLSWYRRAPVGHDAVREKERIQIKCRAYGETKKSLRLGVIKPGAPCDTVLLWQAPYAAVCECLARLGSKARARGALSVSAFSSWLDAYGRTSRSKIRAQASPDMPR
jgi:hypothetical protein